MIISLSITGFGDDFSSFTGLVLDKSDEYFYVSDYRSIYRVTINTLTAEYLTGSYDSDYFQDGSFQDAHFGNIQSITIDNENNLYVIDNMSYMIRTLVMADKIVMTLAGQLQSSGDNRGFGFESTFGYLTAITVSNTSDTIYVIDQSYEIVVAISIHGYHPVDRVIVSQSSWTVDVFGMIYDITEQFIIFTSPSSWNTVSIVDIETSQCQNFVNDFTWYYPQYLTSNSNKSLIFVTDYHRVIMINTTTMIPIVIAGQIEYASYNDGRGDEAYFNYPAGLAVDMNSTYVLVADSNNNLLRNISLVDYYVSTTIFSPNYNLLTIYDVTFDLTGDNFYLVCPDVHVIYRVDSRTLDISIFLGGYNLPGYFDGPAMHSRFYYPLTVNIDKVGNLYIVDNGNYNVRIYYQDTGFVATFAGYNSCKFYDISMSLTDSHI
jgi:hypothetical protein